MHLISSAGYPKIQGFDSTGYVLFFTETEVRKRPQESIQTNSGSSDKSCEVGLLQCGQNADCVPKVNSKSKVGTCQCREGFVFDSGGTCVASVTEKTVSKIFLFSKKKL